MSPPPREALERQDGPTILVGHSWGGTVITEAGIHPRVAGLVYVSALAPDAGQTTRRPVCRLAATPNFVIDVQADGFGYLNPAKFKAGFAARPQRRRRRLPARCAGAHQHVGVRHRPDQRRLAEQAKLGRDRHRGPVLRSEDARPHGRARRRRGSPGFRPATRSISRRPQSSRTPSPPPPQGAAAPLRRVAGKSYAPPSTRPHSAGTFPARDGVETNGGGEGRVDRQSCRSRPKARRQDPVRRGRR